MKRRLERYKWLHKDLLYGICTGRPLSYSTVYTPSGVVLHEGNGDKQIEVRATYCELTDLWYIQTISFISCTLTSAMPCESVADAFIEHWETRHIVNLK